MTILRNRIKEHRKVRFGDLVPHELNPRTHSEAQRAVLAELYQEVGFARSLLAYELPDGRLKLIDGHLRRDLTPDEVLDVEVLDVNDAEARALLLAIDPLAQLAGTDQELLDKLRQTAEQDSAACRSLRQALVEEEAGARRRQQQERPFAEQFLVVVFCADEGEQRALLERFHAEGLTCQAKIA
jgi:ParB-like chromosome segregation protein Spo0J